MKIKLIIWDWNGTLLDDVEYSKNTINIVLKKYGLKTISTEEYRDIFSFPVKDYYRKIGFDFSINPFEIVGADYIDLYNKDLNTCKLRNDAVEILKTIQTNNIQQIVISAREKESLIDDMNSYNILEYFTQIKGIEDIYAGSKEYLFEETLKKCQLSNDEILLIGDTIHDYEIAQKFGINFLLIKTGHQSLIHFKDCKNLKTIDNLSGIFDFI